MCSLKILTNEYFYEVSLNLAHTLLRNSEDKTAADRLTDEQTDSQTNTVTPMGEIQLIGKTMRLKKHYNGGCKKDINEANLPVFLLQFNGANLIHNESNPY